MRDEGSVPFSQAKAGVDSKEGKEIQEFFQRPALFRRKRSLFLRSRIKKRLPAERTKRVEDIQWKFFLAEDAFEMFHLLGPQKKSGFSVYSIHKSTAKKKSGSGLDIRHFDIKEIPIWRLKEYG